MHGSRRGASERPLINNWRLRPSQQRLRPQYSGQGCPTVLVPEWAFIESSGSRIETQAAIVEENCGLEPRAVAKTTCLDLQHSDLAIDALSHALVAQPFER